MSTEAQVRDNVVSLLNPAWVIAYPTIPIFYENTVKINLDAVGASFLRVSVNFVDSLRQGIDPQPYTASYGEIALQLFAKDGQGTKVLLDRMSFLRTTLKYQNLTHLTTDCPRPGKKQSRDGWTSQDLIVPFNYWQ